MRPWCRPAAGWTMPTVITEERTESKKVDVSRLSRVALTALMQLGMSAAAAWSALAIYYSNLPAAVRPVAAGLYGLASLAAILFAGRRRVKPGFCTAFAAVLLWWLAIPPSNSRNWQPDVAVLPWAEISGDAVTIHNIRNCDYRTETDYAVRHYDRTVSLAGLRSVDLFQVYWGSPLIAHTMLSFGFQGGEYVCVSIETRKQTGERYSALKGFFKQYELTYVVADERDLVRLRTNFRGEDVYLFRLNVDMEFARKVFLDYIRQINSLKNRAAWYNALTSNCTTNIRAHAAPYSPAARLDWRIIVNGYIDVMLYGQGYLDGGLALPELKKKSRINGRARQAGDDPHFSELIRRGLPGMG